MTQGYASCRYFRPKVDVANVSKIGVCVHPNSGIDITENVASSLCTICCLFRGRKS